MLLAFGTVACRYYGYSCYFLAAIPHLRSTHTYLSKKDRQCKQYSHVDFINCVTDEIKDSPKFSNLSCIPSSFASLINYNSSSLRHCNKDDDEAILFVTNLIVERLVFYTGQIQDGVSGKCVWPCTMKTFDVQHTRLSNAGASKCLCYKSSLELFGCL